MGFLDIAITVAFTSIAFLLGFCARGLFADGNGEQWPVIDRSASRYEPPRREERL